MRGPVLIVAGERSGETHGAAVVRAARILDPSIRFFGIGGPGMAEAGVEILFPMDALAVVGLAEVVTELPRLQRLFGRLRAEVRARRPAAALLIDSPDFNLRLARRLKAFGVPVLYYVSPTVWAWRPGRLEIVRQTVAEMLLIFPFETEIYRRAGIPARYVGHPLVERVRARYGRDEFFARHGLDPRGRLVSLLPGSRRSEIRRHWPVLSRALPALAAATRARLALVRAPGFEDGDFPLPPGSPPLTIVSDDPYEAMAASDLVLSAMGTANLEAALLGAPLIAFYRLSPLTYRLGRPFVRLSSYSIVNILAGRRVVPELVQGAFSPERLVREAASVLDTPGAAEAMRRAYGEIRASLGTDSASVNAARELLALAGGP